jgi:O-antigen/teichoic acid export membrane protein
VGPLTTRPAATPTAPRFQPLQAILTLGGIQALTMGAGLARTKVLALLLGPAGLGMVGVIDQTVALVTHLGSLSFPFAALTYLARRRGERGDGFARLYGAFLKVLLAASVLASAVAIGIALWGTELIAADLAGHRAALVVGLAGAPALAAVAYLRSVLAAVERHQQAALFALLGGVALIGTSYAGVLLGGLPGLYVGNLAVGLVLAPLMATHLRRRGGIGGWTGGASALRVLREEPGLLGFTATIHLLSLFSPLAYLVARVAVLDHHGAVEAGLFHAAYGLAIAMRVVLGQANMLYLTPILNQPTGKAERAAAAADYLRVMVVILVAGALALVLFPREWLLLLYSSRFTGAAAFLAAFVLGEAILLAATVFQMLLIGFGDVRAHALIAVAGQVTLAVLALAWVPALGSLGVALAFVAGHAVILLLLLLRLRQAHDAPALARPLVLLLAALVALGAAGWWAAAAAPAAGWKLALYLLVAAGSLLLLTPAERRWLLAPWRRH